MRASTVLAQSLRTSGILRRGAPAPLRRLILSSTSSSSTTQLLRPHQTQKTPAWSTTLYYRSIRFNSNSSRPLTDRTSDESADAINEEQNRVRREQEPAYQITFTCKPCGHRSTHRMSKHGYHRGTVLIRCPECKNRHVISDNLGIFMDKKSTLEDILAQDGRKVTKGYVDGDMEFWDDGTAHIREKDVAEEKPEAGQKKLP